MTKLLVNQKIDKYTLLKLIGSGGTSVVWECIDQDGNNLALKIFNMNNGVDDLSRRLFEEEYKKTKVLKNKYILTPTEYGEYERSPYLIAPLCDGSMMDELRKRLLNPSKDKNSPVFSEKELAKIIFDVSSGLNYLHSKGIIHNDIKPDNILLKKSKNVVKFVLSDFGISTKIRKTIVNTSSNKSKQISSGMSPEYAAPEQFLGRVDFRTDVFALGAMIYELVSGITPGEKTGICIGQIMLSGGEIPEIDKNISRDFLDLITRMMHRDISGRPKIPELIQLSSDFLKNGYWGEFEEGEELYSKLLHEQIKSNPSPEVNANAEPSENKRNKINMKWILIPLFLFVITIGLYIVVPVIKTHNKKNQAFNLFDTGNYKDAAKLYNQLWLANPEDKKLSNYKVASENLMKFDEVRPFANNIAAVRKLNKWGYVNNDGILISDLIYSKVVDFNGQFGIVQSSIKNPSCGVMTKTGKLPWGMKFQYCAFVDSNKIEVVLKGQKNNNKDTITLTNQ